MPLYEYECPDCGRFELIQKFSDAPLTHCPRCGKDVEKLLSAPAIQFKGTGWYVTDYARKKPPEAGHSNNGNGDSTTSSSPSKDAASSKGDAASTPRTSTSKDSAATGSSSTK